jgi:hypothetical protein
MNICDDINKNILVVSAVRYALTNNNYMREAVQEWITDHWREIGGIAKGIILEDVFEHLDKGFPSPTDFRSWEKFAVDNLYRLSYNDRDQFVKNNGKYT